MVINFETGTVRSQHGDCDVRWGLFTRQAELQRLVVFVNGRSEWIEKYHYLPELLQLPADCGFLTLDHRGQGASGGQRGTVESYDHYVDDLVTVVRQVAGQLPYVGLAHSMGGLILSLATLRGDLQPQALVLASPFLGLPRVAPTPSWITHRLPKNLAALGFGNRRLGIAGSSLWRFEGNRLTHNRERFDAMAACPYPVPSATIHWIAESVKAIETVHRRDLLRQLSIPTLVMIGSKESVVDRRAVKRWAFQAQAQAQADTEYCEFEGARHELFSEIDEYCLPAVEKTRNWFAEFLS